MAETGILLLLLLIASSLLSVSYADVESRSDSNEPQVLNALYYGVITHNGGNDKWCNISLNGSDYIYTNNPYLAIADIVNSTECPSSENIYVNGKKFCIRESVTSLEVFPLHISTSVNVSIPQETGPFTLRYFNAILLCPDSPESSFKITGDGDKTLPKLYISSGYVNHIPKDTCSFNLAITEVGKVSVELAWPTLQTSTNISNFFTWNPPKQAFQNYTKINTTQGNLGLNFTKWSSNGTNKIFTRISGSCSERPQIDNGAERNYDPNKTYGYLDTLYYECLDGYINASEKITCEGNGSWSLALCVRPEATTSTESTTSTEATTSTVSTTSTEATTGSKLSTGEIVGIVVGAVVGVLVVAGLAAGVIIYKRRKSVKAKLTKLCGCCRSCTATSSKKSSENPSELKRLASDNDKRNGGSNELPPSSNLPADPTSHVNQDERKLLKNGGSPLTSYVNKQLRQGTTNSQEAKNSGRSGQRTSEV